MKKLFLSAFLTTNIFFTNAYADSHKDFCLEHQDSADCKDIYPNGQKKAPDTNTSLPHYIFIDGKQVESTAQLCSKTHPEYCPKEDRPLNVAPTPVGLPAPGNKGPHPECPSATFREKYPELCIGFKDNKIPQPVMGLPAPSNNGPHPECASATFRERYPDRCLGFKETKVPQPVMGSPAKNGPSKTPAQTGTGSSGPGKSSSAK